MGRHRRPPRMGSFASSVGSSGAGCSHKHLLANCRQFGALKVNPRGVGVSAGDPGAGRLLGRDAAAGGAAEDPLLKRIGLVDVFDRVARLGERGRERLDPHRAPVVDLDDHAEQPAVHLVEPRGVDLEPLARRGRRWPRSIDARARRPRRSRARAGGAGWRRGACRASAGDARARRRRRSGSRAAGAARDDAASRSSTRVEVEPHRVAEAREQRRGEQARARGRADQRERLERDLDGRGVGRRRRS